MLYALLEKGYSVYLHCSENEKARKYLYKQAELRGIKQTKASPLALVVVKMLFKFPEKSKSPYQYTAALRYASLTKVPPDAIAEEIGKKGNGIDKWEERFARAMPKKPRAAALKSSGDRGRSKQHASESANSEDDQEWNEDDAEGDDAPESASSEDPDELEEAGTFPTLSWENKALKAWQSSAAAGRRVRLTVEPHGALEGLVVKTKRLTGQPSDW
jgi:hypothetical protein